MTMSLTGREQQNSAAPLSFSSGVIAAAVDAVGQFTFEQLALARSARAVLAAVRQLHALAQGRGEHRLLAFDEELAPRRAHRDLEVHGPGAEFVPGFVE